MWGNFLPSWETLKLSIWNLLRGFSYSITCLLSLSWFTLCRPNVRFLSHLTTFELLNSMLGAKIGRLKLHKCISSSDIKGSTPFMLVTVRVIEKKSKFSAKVLLRNGIASSRLALGSFHRVIQWKTEFFSLGLSWPEHEIKNHPLSRANFKTDWNHIPIFPLYVFTQ